MRLPGGNGTEGFWAPITANIDWCEGNYEVTYYVAEFWNAMTGLLLTALALTGTIETWKGGHVEFHYVLGFIGLIVVGLGTILFHSTLKYNMQLLDELPLVWGQSAIFYAIHELPAKWRRINYPFAFFLLTLCIISTVTYLVYDIRLIFEGTYATIVIYPIILLGIRVNALERAALGFYFLAIFFYGVGFIFWSIDRFHCHSLSSFRDLLHPTLKPFTQFHAVWHIFVAAGGHSFLLVILRTRLVALSKNYKLRWRFGFLPYYQPLPAKKS